LALFVAQIGDKAGTIVAPNDIDNGPNIVKLIQSTGALGLKKVIGIYLYSCTYGICLCKRPKR
jgi:hypothetical protein